MRTCGHTVPVLAIAHRTPRTAGGCRRLTALGVSVFEVDLQFLAGAPVVSHFLPLLPALPRLRHDRWRFTVRARAAAEEDLAAVIARVPAGSALLVDLKSEDPASAAVLVDLLGASGRPPAGWYVSAKAPAALAVVAAAGYRTWLSIAARPAFAAALVGRLPGGRDRLPTGLDAVTVRHTYLDRATVGRLREQVPRVMAWTVGDVRRAAELAAAGVAGLTSDSAEVHAYAAAQR